MKVLQLTNAYRPFFNDQIKGLERQGIDVTTVAVPRSDIIGDIAGSRSPIDYIKYYPQVLNSVRGEYDIIHANFGLTGPFAICQPKRPVVLTLWGSDLMKKYPRISRISAKLSDDVILPSEAMSPYLSSPHKIIPFGVDPEVFKPISKQQARQRLGWPIDKKIVLFPYQKFRRVKRFDIAENVVKKLESDVELQWLSGVPHQEVPLYMNASDAVIITSDRESGPMVIKEAAMCNVPIVSFDVGFVSDVLKGVSHSYICHSESEMRQHLEAIIQADSRSNGRDRLINKISIDEMAKQIIAVYQDII